MNLRFLHIIRTEARIVAGKKMNLSLTDFRVSELWRSFLPELPSLKRKDATMISAQVVPVDYYANFNPATPFEKWAGAEVDNLSDVPQGMDALVIPEGEYAVFHFKGSAAEAPKVFGYIFGEWLPASEYAFDYRPQFEVLGEKYKNNDPESEEEIWIPVTLIVKSSILNN